jgi:hypothetical protein
VYREMRDEIIEMVGEGPYKQFADHIETQGTEHLLPHPARKRRHADSTA